MPKRYCTVEIQIAMTKEKKVRLISPFPDGAIIVAIAVIRKLLFRIVLSRLSVFHQQNARPPPQRRNCRAIMHRQYTACHDCCNHLTA